MRFVAEDMIGKEYKTNTSGNCFVIDYKNSYDMTVMFYDGYVVKVSKGNLDKGKVKNPFHPNNLVYGLGYYDKTTVRNTPYYRKKVTNLWCNILQRCYREDFKERQKSYTDVTCSKDWYTYSIFEEYIIKMKNFDKFIAQGWELDKDSIICDNKVYSKETCCFIPKELNQRLVGYTKLGEKVLTSQIPSSGMWRVVVCGKHIGCYKTQEEATRVYKLEKVKSIMSLCDKYKKDIDSRAYGNIRSVLDKVIEESYNGN